MKKDDFTIYLCKSSQYTYNVFLKIFTDVSNYRKSWLYVFIEGPIIIMGKW